MPVNEFLVLWLSSWAAIAFFRIAPAFALRGRTLSPVSYTHLTLPTIYSV